MRHAKLFVTLLLLLVIVIAGCNFPAATPVVELEYEYGCYDDASGQVVESDQCEVMAAGNKIVIRSVEMFKVIYTINSLEYTQIDNVVVNEHGMNQIALNVPIGEGTFIKVKVGKFACSIPTAHSFSEQFMLPRSVNCDEQE